MSRIFTRQELDKWVNSLCADYQVIGPKELPAKGIFYQPIADAGELYMGDSFTIEPAKKFFLKAWEYLFVGEFKGNEAILAESGISEKKKILFGLRPCEARGLTLLDKVFDSKFKDNFYINNRVMSIIVGLSCLNPGRECFCTSMGGSPVDSRGMDVEVFAAAGEFIVEAITEAGKRILDSAGRELDKEEAKVWELDKIKRSDVLKRKITSCDVPDDIFESDYWGRVSKSCLSCGICTFLCPTCHCFDLVDEERKRLRCYDGCAFSDFTLEASGVNPRPTKKERYRQRVFHKFNYFKKDFKENLCVGCGRCIRHCPVKIDISEIVANVLSAEKN